MAKASDKKKQQIVIPETAEAKKEALKRAIAQIKKTYGEGSVMRLGEDRAMEVDSIPTGSMLLDLALGVGGVPKGRIVELYGPESSGKTTVALHIIAEAQKKGGEVAFIDVEHALDPVYAKALGVDIDNLLVSQPDSGEQALEIAEMLVRSGGIDALVVDSVAALTTRAEIEGDMGDAHVGQLARLMSQAMRKLTAIVSKTNCVAIFINQIREKIGVMYGNPETTPGGRALKFYSSVRMEVRKGEVIKSGSEIIGAKTRVKITKNKVAPPFKECEFDLIYGKGISRTGEVLDLAVNLDIIKKSGSWFSYGDQKLGQGRDKVKDLLEKDPEFMKEIEEKILADKEKTKELLSVTSDDEPSAEAGAETAVTDTDLVIEAPSDDENFDEFTPVES
ncbi:MAG: recombinase RecA [Oscillospiraceae bacterium]|nr:recombinase RecA [Oscillospiraceae bacterium]MDD6085644.1 recombinase RecA [Oscillospiraceae bacterium]MDY3257103.1 recombinase RecA [Ruminococcus callidus]